MICIPVILALRRLRQEDVNIEATWDPVKEGKKKGEEKRHGKRGGRERDREKETGETDIPAYCLISI